MPVVAYLRPLLEPRADDSDSVSVVETDQPCAVRRMERERISQSMRPILTLLDPLDLELDPVPLFEVVDAPIEGQ